jgi:formylglycine-generating enzyme required for sulfatase activity
MKRLLMVFALFFPSLTLADTLRIGNIRLDNHNPSLSSVDVIFSLSWGNAWRNNLNHDAVWVFVKHRRKPDGAWRHTRGFGVTLPAHAEALAVSDSSGVFIRPKNAMLGPFEIPEVRLTWNYAKHGLSDAGELDVYVGALEMVFVAEGAFYAGDGVSTATIRRTGNNGPYFVAGEAAIPLGGTDPENLTVEPFPWEPAPDFFEVQRELPASFPKGFDAFYTMKFEISQGLVVDFLNRITAGQAGLHTSGSYINEEQGNPVRNGQARNTISGSYPNFSTETPYRPAGFIRHWLFLALADWTGLRPMTELEWEKANRGPEMPVPGEFSWGNDKATVVSGSEMDGTLLERASNSAANVNAAVAYMQFAVDGPLRSGWQRGVTREALGASYWGVRDLTGNVWERVITINSTTGRAFDGRHGDGSLDAGGAADVPNWPGMFDNPHNIGHRGGSFNLIPIAVSARDFSNGSSGALPNYGGRFVRTAPENEAPVRTESVYIPKMPKLAVLANYPNPFNAGTVVRLSVARSGFAVVSLYDLTGRKIAELKRMELAAGLHQFPVSVPALATGVYLIAVEQDGAMAARKITILK